MTRYIALLRGINVGGNTLKMDRLREVCAELGFANIVTYVQSGNVVFDSKGSAASVAKTLTERLTGESRLPVSVVVRKAAELAAVIATNPFVGQPGIDPAKLHVTFLGAAAAKNALAKLRAVDAVNERFHMADREIYLYCPDGYGKAKLSNARIEKLLTVVATTRNWNTVHKLSELASS